MIRVNMTYFNLRNLSSVPGVEILMINYCLGSLVSHSFVAINRQVRACLLLSAAPSHCTVHSVPNADFSRFYSLYRISIKGVTV